MCLGVADAVGWAVSKHMPQKRARCTELKAVWKLHHVKEPATVVDKLWCLSHTFGGVFDTSLLSSPACLSPGAQPF